MMASIQNTTIGANPTSQLQAQLVRSTALVFHVNMFVYGLIAVVALLRLPHLIAIFGTPSEWYTGHFLFYSEPKRPKASVVRHDSSRTIVARHNSTKTVGRNNSTKANLDPHNSSKTAMARNNSTRTVVEMDEYRNGDFHRRRGREVPEPTTISYPPHVPFVPPFLRSTLGVSRIRLFNGYSIGQTFVLTVYMCALVYATYYRSNTFIDATRPAWVAVSQMPLVFALAQKNNLLGAILGYGYEKLNFVHRFAARLVILAANLHSIFYFYEWTAAGTFKRAIARPTNAAGFIALICFDILYIFSGSFWRTKTYNFFIWNHTICIAILLPTVYLHQPSLLPYMFACTFLYGVDRVMRILKTRIATANIVSIPELNATHIEIPNLNSGWRPGQHVRLRIFSRGMGWLGWMEVHPFTIASASDSHEGLVLVCKQAGDWTTRLGTLAKGKSYEGDSTVKVWVEGPYGGTGRMMFTSFSAVVLVVGGSGITFGLAMMQELVERDLKGESCVKYIELVWVCQDAPSVAPFIPVFETLIQQSVYTPLRISVHYTRCLTSALPFPTNPDLPLHYPMTLHPNLTLTAGRPKIGKALDCAVVRAVSLGSGHKESQGITGIAVGVCGPHGLGEDVYKAVAEVGPARRNQVGGIEVHEETFGW